MFHRCAVAEHPHEVLRTAPVLPVRPTADRSPLAARFAAVQKESVLRSSSHRRTSHTTSDAIPHSARRKAAAVALVGVSALIAAAVQSGAATAAPERAPSAAGKVIPGAESVKLTPPSAPS